MSERRTLLLAGAAAAAVSLAAFLFFYRAGTILYYGDAVAHLNIARRLVDSKSPGWAQIGTVWLPLPHLLAAPLVAFDPLWRTGIGAALPSLFGFVAGALFLFGAARELLGPEPALAWATLGIYLTNLNLLYLQSTPMTEAQFLAAFLGAVYFAVRRRWLPCALALMTGTLIRYDAWFYIPFFALYFWRSEGLRRAALFACVSSLGPVMWLLHNMALYGNAMEWYSGPYSALAIQARGLAAGEPPHPGHHSLYMAALYYWKAAGLVIGRVLLWLAVLGAGVLAAARRTSAYRLLPSAFWLLWLPLPFYVLSIAYGGVPIFVPQWWPFSFYNTRYGVEILPAAAVLAPAALLALPHFRRQASLALILFVAVAWTLGVARSRADALVVFREAQVNSEDRRYAVELVARALAGDCREIWLATGDLAGAMTVAGIPFRRTIHQGNLYEWRLVSAHPELMADCVVAQKGDAVDHAIARLPHFESSFRTVLDFSAPAVSRLRVYRRR